MDIQEELHKPDYHHDIQKKTKRVCMIPQHMIEKNINDSFEDLGNPAASKKVLVCVYIRLCKSLLK